MRLKSFLLLAILPFLLVNTSCRSKYEDCTEQDYEDCNTARPVEARVNIRVSINEEQHPVTVKMFDGDFENNNVIWEKQYYEQENYEFLAVEQYFSFTAIYTEQGDTLKAVDGGSIEIISYRMCELRCYEARNLEIDLRK